jgi:hypothetical protein
LARARFTLYYQATPEIQAALPIDMAAGQTRTAIDFVVPSEAVVDQPFAAVAEVFKSSNRPALRVGPPNRGLVAGSVVGPDEEPLAYAQVAIAGFLQTPTQPSVVHAASDGTFLISGVPTGYYQIIASKAGYLPSRPGLLGSEPAHIFIDSAAPSVKVRLRLKRWSIVTGQINDSDGEPIAGAHLELLQLRYEDGRRQYIQSSMSATTDDTGSYRIYGVNTGTYILRASTPDMPGYIPTFLPGTPLVGEAQELRVGDGETLGNVDLLMERGRTVNIRGRLVAPDQTVGSGSTVTMTPAYGQRVATGVSVRGLMQRDGTFGFQNVGTGEYVIQAYKTRDNFWSQGQFGSTRVSVRSEDINDVVVQMSNGTHVSGSVTFHTSDAAPSVVPADVEIIAVYADVDVPPPPRSVRASRARIERNGTFQIAGLTGIIRLEVTRVPSGWSVRDIRVGDTDITDSVLDLRRSAYERVSGVVISLTNQLTSLAGRVTSRGRSNIGRTAYVIAFSEDSSHWYESSRFVRVTQAPASTGRYRFDGLPPGAYYTLAVDALPADGIDAWRNPTYLETCIRSASRVTLQEGDVTTQNLDIVADLP